MERRGDDNTMYIFRQILYNPIKVAILLGAFVYFLSEVVEIIIFAFGKMYKLASVALQNPASQLGAALCGTVGLVIGMVGYGSWAAVTFGLVAGALLGAVGIHGIYSIKLGHHNQKAVEEKKKKKKK